MTTRTMQRRQLSRSRVELFLECPRCFFDDAALGLGRPGGPAFTLNLAVDALLKKEFDQYRASGQPHPLFATVGLEVVPFRHPQLEAWRANFTGMRWQDPVTGWTFFGAVDDVWVHPDGTLVIADYKATSKAGEITAAGIYPGYRRQLEMYQFLFERAGFRVDARSWLVYANGSKGPDRFDDLLRFRTTMIPVDCNRSWVEAGWRAAVACLEGGVRPPPAPACEWCQYVAARAGVAQPAQP